MSYFSICYSKYMRIKNLKKHAGIPKKSRGKGSLNKEILWFHCFKNAGDFKKCAYLNESKGIIQDNLPDKASYRPKGTALQVAFSNSIALLF